MYLPGMYCCRPRLTLHMISFSGISTNQVLVSNSVPEYDSGDEILDVSTAFFSTSLDVNNNSTALTLGKSPLFIQEQSITFVEKETGMATPKGFCLNQNYPNPFNPETKIKFSLPKECQVTIEIYNMLGKKINTLVDGSYPIRKTIVVFYGKRTGTFGFTKTRSPCFI